MVGTSAAFLALGCHEHMHSHCYYEGVGESLVEAAQKLQATLLVLGTRGKGSVKR